MLLERGDAIQCDRRDMHPRATSSASRGRQPQTTTPHDGPTRRQQARKGRGQPRDTARLTTASFICGAHICCAPARCLRERLQSKKRYVPTASGRLCCGQLRVNDFERRRPGDPLGDRSVAFRGSHYRWPGTTTRNHVEHRVDPHQAVSASRI